MTDEFDVIGEIDSRPNLFLIDLRESAYGALHLQVAEGLPVGPRTVRVADVEIVGGIAIEVTNQSRVFEIVWANYVGYSVLNESYADVSREECSEGKRFQIYSKSHFMQFMSQVTFACDDYPGPTRHYSIVCENHIVHVLAVEPPTVRRVSSSGSVSHS